MSDDDVSIFLVDDEADVTRGLAWLLESVGVAANAFQQPEAFLEALKQHHGAACAVLDMRMPGLSGIELLDRLARLRPDIPVIILTAHGDVPNAVQAMKLGAVDFLQKPFNPQQFLDSVQRARREAVARHAKWSQERERREQLEKLSVREREVMDHMLRGQSSKEIARDLDISPKTVDVHRANILRKMEAATARELAGRFRAGSLIHDA